MPKHIGSAMVLKQLAPVWFTKLSIPFRCLPGIAVMQGNRFQ